MNIRLTDGLPFVRAAILHNQQEIVLDNVLLSVGAIVDLEELEIYRSSISSSLRPPP